MKGFNAVMTWLENHHEELTALVLGIGMMVIIALVMIGLMKAGS